MYIAYDEKNGIEYAKICMSKRNGKKTSKDYIYLGRVLDKEKGIFQNRERGVFTYDIMSNSYGKADASFVPDLPGLPKERLILDFGDAFFLNGFIALSGMKPALNAITYGNPDTLHAMIFFYILFSGANCHAGSWWEGSYARILFPKANLTSQRISDFLAAVGKETVFREFFREYILHLVNECKDSSNIVIDSTGLPNSIHFPLTAISNHNGEISNEVRLIYVVHQETGLPIYFRYCPGNIIDTTTLIRTISELKASGVNAKFAILDAGYYDDKNITALYKNKISFITRLRENRQIYKQLIKEHLATIESKENFVSYNSRYAYIKCVKCELVAGYPAYAYIGLDIDRKSSETKKLFQRAHAHSLSTDEVYERLSQQGVFILVSSRPVAKEKILPLYYTRQQIEQIFDIGKNYAEMLPLRVETEETFRGHLLLTFIASVIVKKLQNRLKDSPYNPISVFANLRNQKCKVYDNVVITQEPYKKANDCYKLFKIDCPVEILR